MDSRRGRTQSTVGTRDYSALRQAVMERLKSSTVFNTDALEGACAMVRRSGRLEAERIER